MGAVDDWDVSSQRQHSLDEVFLKDAVMDRLKDDVPQVVAAALKALEVSEMVNEEMVEEV